MMRYIDPFCDPTARITRPQTNPYVEKMKQLQLDLSWPLMYGPQLQSVAGRWHETFKAPSNTCPLIAEIGCHEGKTLMQLAQSNPHFYFVGFDITFKRVVRTAEKLSCLPSRNGRAVLCDARFLNKIFAPQELDGVIIFYPDPWPKRRQRKHRLINKAFATMIHALLKQDGFIWIRTDHSDYFEQIWKAFSEPSHWDLAKNAKHSPYTQLWHQSITSTFEQHFQLAGINHHENIWVKKLPPR